MRIRRGFWTGFSVLAVAASGLLAQSPCFPGSEFSQRREKLVAAAGDGVILLDASLFPSEFTYLTGVQSRTAKLIIIPEALARRTPKPGAWVTTIYLPPKSPRAGVWDDPVLSAGDDTLAPTGIQNSAPERAFADDIVKIGLITDTIYIPFRPGLRDSERPPDDLKFVEQVRTALPTVKIKNLLPIVSRIRWTKTAAEVEAMRSACGIVTEAFKEAARLTRPGLKESDVEAAVNYVFRRLGSERPAFLIIGSGPNSCVLHHMKNDRLMEEHEVLVVDIGNVYCSLSDDLTRTVPTSGKFTGEQKKIYEIVLQAQKTAIAMIKPGVTLAQVHAAARRVIEDAGYGKYFIHGTSHTLNGGMAADPLSQGTWRPEKPPDRYEADDVPIEPGSMFTVEPGIYIPEKKIGIRIEDSILVTADGCEVLTAAAPKEIADIENLMKETPIYIKK